MQNVIVAWCNSNEHDFEQVVPLQFVGERNVKLNFSNDLHVLFLKGMDSLSVVYKKTLSDLGYHLHDGSSIYQELDRKYSQLNRFGDYEKKCFLRWLTIYYFFKGEQITHYDGDIVFNEDVTIIQKLLQGFTFVLGGCPAFTCIHDLSWFDLYKYELDRFIQDIDGYSAKAWQERVDWEITSRTRWAGCRFRPIITSDQDFISHLIHTGIIVQDSVEKISMALHDYMVFQNPLFVEVYDNNFPFIKCVRENGIDYFLCKRIVGQDRFYKKRVLFWHMQASFNFYLAKFVFRRRFLWFLPLGRLKLYLESSSLEDFLNKRMRKLLNHTSRLNVYHYFFDKNNFSGVMRDSVWWRKGIFS